MPPTEKLLTPGEVAGLFGVDPKTVTRWAKAGRLSAIRTLGGHRRFSAGEVTELLQKGATTASLQVDMTIDATEEGLVTQDA